MYSFKLFLQQNTCFMRIKFLFSIADCGCNLKGLNHCNVSDGNCKCLRGYTGPKCYDCEEHYYKKSNDTCEGIVCSFKHSRVKSFRDSAIPVNTRYV